MVTIACKQGPAIPLALDDYTFHMVVRRGPIISAPGKPMYVEVYDANGLVFRMNVLDASVVTSEHAQFSSGLLGQWRYSGTTDRLKLVKAREFQDKDSVVKFLCDASSHESVRILYSQSLGS
jgi:hypothetical protein